MFDAGTQDILDCAAHCVVAVGRRAHPGACMGESIGYLFPIMGSAALVPE